MIIGEKIFVWESEEKREVKVGKERYYLFWKNGICFSCIKSGAKKKKLKEIRKIIGNKINLGGSDDDYYYFLEYSDAIYVGKEKPYIIMDSGKIPYEFFKRNVWVLSLKRKYFDRIMVGRKRYELRKEIPKNLKIGDLAFLYVSGQGIMGLIEIGEIKREKVEKLSKYDIGVSKKELQKYFFGYQYGYLIEIAGFWKFKKCVSLEDLRKKFNFKPPTNFKLISHRPSLIEFILNQSESSFIMDSGEALHHRK